MSEQIEVTGRVKWFSRVKGFGFLVSEQADGDVLVHCRVLRPFGRGWLPDGAILTVKAEMRARGLQATEVLEIDLAPAADQRPVASRDFVGNIGKFEPVEFRWFNVTRGYGFVTKDGQDIFVHADQLRAGDLYGRCEAGMPLEARSAKTSRGLVVVEIREREQLDVAAE